MRSRGRPGSTRITPQSTSASAASTPATAAGSSPAARRRRPSRRRPRSSAWRPGRAATTLPAHRRRDRRRPAPRRGPGARRARAHEPFQQQHVAGGQRRPRPARRRAPCALDRQDDAGRRSSVTIPGKTAAPISGERGGITTSATPDRAGEQLARDLVSASAVAVTAYCAISVRAWSERSTDSARGRALGQQPRPEQQRDRDRPDRQRHADEREREEAEAPPAPRAAASSATSTLTGEPVSTRQRARVGREGHRHQQLRRRPLRAAARRAPSSAAARRPRRWA